MKQRRSTNVSRSPALPGTIAASPAEVAYRSAVQAAEAGQPALAMALYGQCLGLDPSHVEAHHDLGVLAAQRGAHAEAIRLFEAAIRLRPGYAEAHANLCLLLGNVGQIEGAVEAGRKAVALKPGFANAHSNLANALEARGEIAAALRAYRTAAKLNPRFSAVYVKMADLLNRQGKPAAALEFISRAIGLDPKRAEAFRVRGLIRGDLGQADAALEDFRTAVALGPPSAPDHVNLACALINRGELDEAAQWLSRAIAIDPENADAYGNLGTVRQKQGLARQAFDAYHRAVTLNPNYGQAYSNLAGLLRDVGEVEAAVSMGEVAVRLMPGSPDPYINMAGALRQQGRPAEAIVAYRQALALKPDLGDVRVELCHYRQHACDWAGLEAEQQAAMAFSFRAGQRVAPFPILGFDSAAADQHLAARVWAAGLPRRAAPLARYVPREATKRGRRLRVGYLSADFYNHATATLIVELLEHHNKTRFETFGYSIGREDGSIVRGRLVAALDHFLDLRGFSHEDAAARIHADEIDILIDLKGYTEGARTEILACRPAPIQVNYLGFPATMGADFIDYIVADGIVAPMERQSDFDEKIVHLPGSYQPNDSRRPIAEPPTRAQCGLPEGAFVYCCFNNSYKITVALFDIWMRLLCATPDSVLWLFEANDRVAANLRREAGERGVDPGRLVFAPRVSAAEHMARLGLADLFLDTLPVNAHTTASEALWAGLPVLTCLGETFVARVAGSLVHAVGLPELATSSLADYEATALSLALDPSRLKRLRQGLQRNRLTASLFDGARYARNFEAALLHMAALRDAGRAPEPFALGESGGATRAT